METPPKYDENNNSLSLKPDEAWAEIGTTQKFLEVPSIPSSESKWNTPSSDCVRIVCMSDTHNQHRDIAVPKGDILIHGGDFTQIGEVKIIKDMVSYFKELHFPTVVCIAGNHELTLDLPYYERAWRRFHRKKLNGEEGKQCLLEYMDASFQSNNKFYYLENSLCRVPIGTPQQNQGELTIYGSPWSAEFCDWAFNIARGQPSLELWSKIPSESDIVITHGPPLGRGDLVDHGRRVGCYNLLRQIQDRVRPRLMVFGHVHEAYGTSFDGTTMFVNASNLDLEYENVHPCTVIDLPHDPSQPPRLVVPDCKRKGEELLAWFHQIGCNNLVEVLEQSGCSGKDLPSENELLQTAEAYRKINGLLTFKTTRSLKAKIELRKALLQLHAESF